MDKKLEEINPEIVREDGSIFSMADQYRLWKNYQFNISYPMIVSADSKSMGLGHLEDHPIVLNTKTIVKCRKGKNSSHFLTPSVFKHLGELMEAHKFSLESKTRDDSILLVLREKDYKNDPIIVSLACNKKIRGQSVHLITSIYGRANYSSWLKSSLASGCKIYRNTKKERNLKDIRVQFSHQIDFSLINKKYNKNRLESQESGEKKMKEPQFEAFVTNLNLYTGGLLEGKWMAFPATLEQIQETLEEIRVTEGKHEYFFTDYDFSESVFLQDVLGEFENITELNTLATLLADHEAEKEKIEGYVNKADCRSIKEICNVIVQADQIEYAPYEFEGMKYLKEQDASAELLYGYTLAERSGVYQQLQNMDMTNYVDYESYGRDAAINGNIELLENGYLDMEACSVDLEAYSMQELMIEAGLEKEKTPIEKAPRL